MDIVYLFNAFEATLWTFMAGGMAWKAFQLPQRRVQLILAGVTFIAFAGSEIVEMQTGAWWRPLWLMVWKGVCIVTLVCIGVTHYRWHCGKTSMDNAVAEDQPPQSVSPPE